MKIHVVTDQSACIREIRYVCRLFSTILDAHFVAQDFSEPLRENEVGIAYCHENHFSLIPRWCRIKIVSNHGFWKYYLNKKRPRLNIITIEGLSVIGVHEKEPFIKTDSTGMKTNLDLFSSAFFLISRIEESYAKGDLDIHDRYKFSNSIIGEELIKQPIINLYAQKLAEWIEREYKVTLSLREKRMGTVITHDIDAPYRYLTLKAEISEVANSLWSQEGKYKSFDDLKRYISFLLGISADPYDVFDYIIKMEEKRNIKSTYFILSWPENRWGLKKRKYARQLQTLKALGNEIALHPSYNNYSNSLEVESEKDSLTILSGVMPEGTRNHFLRFDLPDAYERFEKLGFLYDSTLGFAEREGFRAGICTPFKPFNVNNRRVVDLIEIPLVVMDSTLINYRGFRPDEALETIKELVDNVNKVQGTIVFNWHNHLLVDDRSTGWRNVYEKSIEYLRDKNAIFYTCSELAKKWKAYWD